MIEQMAQLDIPLQVIHFDCFWMKPYHWCDFEWDLQSFPNAKGMIEKIKRRGLKVSLWINPYISQFSELFEEGRESRYFIMHQNGDVWQSDIWQPGMAFVDFTNPDACKWYSSKLEKLIDDGIDSFKTDFGEMIPTTDVQFFDGSESESMHNFYSFLYNKTVFDLLERKLGKGEAVVFSRSATAGGQKYPVHWGGDSYCTYESMAESLRGGLSLGLSGYAFWSHDIGGFGGFSAKPEPDLYKRWFPFGLLSSHSRLHGNTTLRVPWLFGEEAVAVARFFTKLKCRLMPYLYWYAHQAHHEGIPLLRAMILEFEDDPTCKTLDCQYMLGESLLIAPVFNKQGEVTYYVPNGMWTKLLTGEKVIGGRWYREVYDFLSLPILVRPDSIIPIGNNSSSTEYDFADEVTLHVYNLNENVWHEVFVVCREGEDELMIRLNLLEGEFTIEPIKANKQWYIMLHNVSSLHSADNATYNSKDNGCYIIPTDFSRRVIIKVAEDYQY